MNRHMATYAYIARDPAGQRVTGQLAGASEQAVLAELHTRKLAPVQVKPVRPRKALGRGVSGRSLAVAYRQLADLLRAGVPLLRALQLLGRSKSNPRLGQIMASIAEAVSEGERLADAMSRSPQIFPPIQVAMIRAGERGGFLEPVLARLGRFLEHQAEMRGKVIGNLIYPAVLLMVGLAVVIAALVFFVPKFEKYYAGIEVPLPTKVLLAASAVFTQHGLLLVIGVPLIVAGLWWLCSRPGSRRTLARWQLRVPKLGKLTRGLAVARFSRILGTLLENGIPMLAAMQISRDAAGNIAMAEAIDRATEAVRAGESLARPLGESGLVDEDVLEMIAVGESANNLPDVLITVAETIEKRVDAMLTLFVRLMEPLLLLALGGVVAFIFLALVIPMMRLSAAM